MNMINIYLDCETMNLPENLKLSDDELKKYNYKSIDEVDILLELAIIVEVIKDGKIKTTQYTNLCKPKYKIDPAASAKHGIGNDMVGMEPDIYGKYVELPQSHEIVSYKVLKQIIDNVYDYRVNIIGHNIDFDIDVLKRVKDGNGNSIDFDKDNIYLIDSMRVARHIFGKESVNYPQSYSLQYLLFYTDSHKKIKLQEDKDRYNHKSHNALSDAYSCKFLIEYFKDNFDIDFEKMAKMKDEPIELSIMPFGFERVRYKKFSEIDTSDLLYIYENYDDIDVKYSCKKQLEKRNIDVDKKLFNFGKYKNMEISSKEIPVDYLLWVHNEYKNISDDFRGYIKEELKNRGIDDPYMIITFDREFKGKSIDDNSIPIEKLESWTQLGIDKKIVENIDKIVKKRKLEEKEIVEVDGEIADFDDFFNDL